MKFLLNYNMSGGMSLWWGNEPLVGEGNKEWVWGMSKLLVSEEDLPPILPVGKTLVEGEEEGVLSLFPGRKLLISLERLGSFSWNFDNVNKISLETFSQPQVGSLKYLRTLKLQFLNATYNLLTTFLMEKNQALLFFQLTGMGWSSNLHWGCPLTN